MSKTLVTNAVADRVASKVRRDGFDRCTAQDVLDVSLRGGLEPSVIGEEYDAALESRILQELDEYGFGEA